MLTAWIAGGEHPAKLVAEPDAPFRYPPESPINGTEIQESAWHSIQSKAFR